MKTMTSFAHDRNQATPMLWIPLPECQQEMLSGGAPQVKPPKPGEGGGTNADWSEAV